MFDQTPNYNGAYGTPMGGYNYGGFAPQQMPKVMNNLTADEIKMLQQNRSQFSLGLTERESLQAACNHRSADGTSDSLVFDPDTGIARCTICGYEFRPIEADTSYDSIKDSADRIVDILQTIKIMYTDLPADASREYFNIIPLIEKIPELFKFAAKNFAKHEFNAWQYQNHNMNGVAMFQNLNNIFGGGYMPPQYGAAPQQPGVPFGQAPMGYQQPMPGANMFGYPGAQTPGYQPQTPGYQYQPTQAPTPVAPTVQTPAAPADQAQDAVVTQTVVV